MKPSTMRLAVGLVIATAAPLATGYAQIMQLSLRASEIGLNLRPDQPGRPFDTGGYVGGLPQPLQLDIFFDARLPNLGDPAGHGFDGVYEPTDPARNYWRVRFDAEGVPGGFDISRPFDRIEITGNSMFITGEVLSPEIAELFVFNILFLSPTLSNGRLPVTTETTVVVPDLAFLALSGGPSLGALEGLSRMRVTADFNEGTLSVAQAFTPVPEPAELGGAGVALCLLATGLRRRRRG